jgi:hypothetical protein
VNSQAQSLHQAGEDPHTILSRLVDQYTELDRLPPESPDWPLLVNVVLNILGRGMAPMRNKDWTSDAAAEVPQTVEYWSHLREYLREKVRYDQWAALLSHAKHNPGPKPMRQHLGPYVRCWLTGMR